MGQNSSLPKPVGRKSLRSPFPRRSKSNHSTLSHTFNLMDSEDRVELLNINIATEEELMTLPGINREVAKSIVDHRKAIGRFKKVEDLALVRGIGADKLEQIRPEICVGKRLSSRASSRAQSFDSLKSQDSRNTTKSCKLVNINKANAFELQSVHGITQEIAASIVEYRTRKGLYKRVDDLIKVKRIDRMRLGNISQFLTVDDEPIDKPILNNINNTPTNHRRCNGTLPKANGINGLQNTSMYDIFELLSTYSPRPILEELFTYERQGERAIRIAVWNVHKFSYEKANNLGVREVVCRTILENGWSIIALQDVEDIKALQIICDELNRPKLRRVAEWTKNSRQWCYSLLDGKSNGLGFLYDKYSGGINVELTSVKEPKVFKHDYEVIDGNFRIGELSLHVVNSKVHDTANVSNLNCKLEEYIISEEAFLFVGDFSDISNHSDYDLGGKLQSMISSRNMKAQENNHHNFGYILGNIKVQMHSTGISGVTQDGLMHLAIPDGWKWGGEVSPFRPVWTEIFVSSSSGTAL